MSLHDVLLDRDQWQEDCAKGPPPATASWGRRNALNQSLLQTHSRQCLRLSVPSAPAAGAFCSLLIMSQARSQAPTMNIKDLVKYKVADQF